LNERLDSLPGYPFARLRRLLEGVSPPAGVDPVLMSIGEPRHQPPAIVAEVLAARAADWGKYPPLRGTPEFRRAVADWLTRRYRLPTGFIEAEKNLLPVAGTREAIFMFGLVAVGRKGRERAERQRTYGHNVTPVGREARAGKPLVLVPNPLYHVYAGAAIMAGGEPVFLPATKATGFLPDYAAVPDDIWRRVALVYLCSPANPQGAMATRPVLEDLIARAMAHDFIIAIDECYSEIYDDSPPAGIWEACAAMGADAARARDHVVAFNSLSKRSNCAGLRSGFVAGGADLIAAFARLREFASCATPLPIIHAATELWRDEAHVGANRARYRAKLDIADGALGNRLGYYRPAGGFFLWLDVSGPGGDGEEACRRLWRDAAIRVLPGAYLCPEDDPAPGAAYIRVALVQDEAVLRQSLARMAEVLDHSSRPRRD
jgi:succinyldiaminopimelate transaminase